MVDGDRLFYLCNECLHPFYRMIGCLGSGQFGTVAQAVWHSPDGPVDVAVKTLKEQALEEEKLKFLQEAVIMGQFHHPNIVQLYGVVTVGQPVSWEYRHQHMQSIAA